MELFSLIVLLLLSFYLLAILCEDFFIPSLDILAQKLRMSSDVAGATLMAVGSSAPELFTSLFAVLRPGNVENVGSGTIVGSAIFNVLVIVGAAGLYTARKLTWQPIARDIIFYCISIIILLISFSDGIITPLEAVMFCILYVIYVIAVINWQKFLPYQYTNGVNIAEKEAEYGRFRIYSKKLIGLIVPDTNKKPNLYLVGFSISILLIAALSFILVEAAVSIGHILMIDPTLIALTVLAAGTSIPDLLSSIIVAKQGRGDMAVSNAIGSNVFDILFGLGFPWLLVTVIRGETISVQTENLVSSVILLFATVTTIMLLLIARKWKLGNKAGWILIGIYLLYIVFIIVSTLSN